MNDKQIFTLVQQFRIAIEKARDNDEFIGDDFDDYPRNCCGDTSCLLAEYLRMYGQECIYVWGEDDMKQTHAWLVVKDARVKNPKPNYYEIPDAIRRVYEVYSNGEYDDCIVTKIYTEADIENGLIIDITADQFGYAPIYIGYICDINNRFKFCSANDYSSLGSQRLRRIYKTILNYI